MEVNRLIRGADAVCTAHALLGTPYDQLDCIGLIVRVIRTAPGGDPGYKCQGTNWLWRSVNNSPKYRDLTWRQEGLTGAQAGMLAFKRTRREGVSPTYDVHHVGLVTGEGTVIHSSSTKGCVVETPLDGGWALLAAHKHIKTAPAGAEGEESMATRYRARVATDEDPLRVRDTPGTGKIIGYVPRGEMVDVLSEGDWPRVRYGELVGYASAAYLARVEDAPQMEDAGAEDSRTTLMREDGVSIVLCGRWRVAQD